ncbi:glycosyltransferase [Flavobacterium macacae]|uniref:Glycosyltransferase n=2 Tax=Flavobacterium macacae TaxID=2488993 RepID=A0A3P3WHN4_9FLAO|nr:glycosyltransferase [Flavobacterium macacae]
MLLSMQKIAIIIPCYNEEKRLQEKALLHLLEHTTVDIFLANDGSKDNTLPIIEKFSALNSERCFVFHYPQNQGKANTVFKSVNEVLAKNEYDFIGYFDADFSTPASEITRMTKELNKNEASFIFGSRVLLLNSNIQRKYYRHIIGRVIVTFINLKFRLGIYDTQCGAKIFSKQTAAVAFNKEFSTSWLFDVEVFIRLRKENLLLLGQEFPLKEWKDIEGSKLGFKTSFKILKELYLLIKKY